MMESNTGNSSGSESTDECQPEQSADEETVPATSYVTQTQYQRWNNEADKRNQSVSTLISTMVETGLRQIKLEKQSPSEIIELRRQLRTMRNERNELRNKLSTVQQQDYQIGLGKIKDLIVGNPGIKRQEIVNYASENVHIFVNEYLDSLESTGFEKRNEGWFPPETMGDN